MNKKFFISWIVIFVIWMAGSFLLHGLWLGATYEAMTDVYRPAAEQEKLFPIMLLAHVMLAGGFVWIYQRGRENTAWLPQGLRFGAIIALFAPIPTYMIYYTVQSMESSLAIRQIVGEGALLLLLGAVVAFLYRGESAA
jgi:hypothetical protein